jgi:tRNA(His) guanylyltransferase
MFDELGDRMKGYEEISGCNQRFLPMCPIIVRLDGKAFHSFTKGLAKPYDVRLSSLMGSIAGSLVAFTDAVIGYTQSDEITLIMHYDDYKSQVMFNGRRDKLNSVLASYASVIFNKDLQMAISEKANKVVLFDCRSFSVPNQTEAINALIWREQDAVRNSISMAAQAKFSTKELHGKSCKEMKEMLLKAGVQWDNYPSFFKRGIYIHKKKVTIPFTKEEIEKLPEKHAARANPNLVVERHVREVIVDLPSISNITNREQFVFGGVSPLIKE